MASSSLLSYENLTYEVKKGRGTYIKLVDDVSVHVRAGELLAIMGPSGAGKTTLLELMSFRKQARAGASIQLNGQPINAAIMDQMSAFMESEDVLLSVLTVRESITYTLRLHDPSMARKDVAERVERVIKALGLRSCAENRIGDPLSRGISTGQKRRTVAACAMVTYPRILFLDEITSGLDSTSAEQVLAAIKSFAQEEGIIVIASIHQPSASTLSYFTNLLMLSGGKTCYSGPVEELGPFLERWGHPVPRYSTPAEHAMYFLNDDFEVDNFAMGRPEEMRQFYLSSFGPEKSIITLPPSKPEPQPELALAKRAPARSFPRTTLILCERTLKNYCRNVFAYGTRLVVYAGMGFLTGSVALKASMSDENVLPRFGFYFVTVCFLSFVSAAGVPAFLEERAVFYREKRNGLYSALPFAVSNSLVNIPFLFACSFMYTIVCYWMGLQSGASAFFSFLCYLFLGILAAEAQMAAVAALFPGLMAAYSIVAMLNGLWMGICGFLIRPNKLPRFWYIFHHVNYMKYSLELVANSDMKGLTFFCEKSGNKCRCSFPLYNPINCSITGRQILNHLEIDHISYGKWVGILLALFVFNRILMYIILLARSR